MKKTKRNGLERKKDRTEWREGREKVRRTLRVRPKWLLKIINLGGMCVSERWRHKALRVARRAAQ